MTHEGDDVLKVIVDINPLEAARLNVELVERRVLLHQTVKVADEGADAAVLVVFEQVPVEAAFLAPLAPLCYLAAHEQKLLARVRPHVGVERAQAGELPIAPARHL